MLAGGRSNKEDDDMAKRAERAVSLAERDDVLSAVFAELIASWRNTNLSTEAAAAALEYGRLPARG